MKQLSPAETSALSIINNDHMLAQTQTWALINSGSRNLDGLAKMAEALREAFSVLPGDIVLHDPAKVDAVRGDGSIAEIAHGQHLTVSVRPEAPVRLILTGHMDTVFPIDSDFQTLTWLEGDEKQGGVLGGPGLADMKGGISVMIAALQALEASKYASNLGYDILINSDEEVGSPSSAALIAKLAAGKTAALTYEPAALPDGTLAGARGGSGNFSIIFSGKSAHAGRNPQDGRNAIVAASDMAVQLKALTRDGLSVNPAKIEGGAANNVVPDHAILRVNFRPKSLAMQALAQNALDALIADIAKTHNLDVHCHGSFGRPPKEIDGQAGKLFELVKKCGSDLGLDIGWKSTGGVCDGNNIAACGVPVVDTMGVRGGSIHSADEFLITDSLSERARLSALTIMRIAQKGGL
ncbi:hydrolase [Sphingorhabdus sp. Alg239-R122]|uniref:hydrolase n=1 Tax=Sphingorhabdus sp. Alg239-R122 TaxID=2305989 RepID=UPI0013D96EDC|nr:hydrolase [Sphingorhabdus sp. Alg239-R122]